MSAPERIATHRLTLRRLRADDAAAIAAGLDDWDVARMLTRPPYPYALADAETFLTGAMSAPWTFAIVEDGAAGPDGPPVGCIGFDHHLGYWLARPAWGRGIATEAAAALVDAYLARRAPVVLISGYLHDNAASARVLAKLGFQRCGERHVPSAARSGPVRHIDMRLWPAAWPRVRRRLLDAGVL